MSMSDLAAYANHYRNIKLERREGILQVSLHTGGAPLKWGAVKGSVHEQLGDAFYNIGRDPQNRVVILTGTGDSFCTEFNFDELPMQAGTPDGWYDITREGKDLLTNLLEIDVPVIGAVNGPALIHAELVIMSDIVLAAEHAVVADLAHFPGGTVPGDGAHVIWPMLLGPNRGRYFLMMGEQIPAAEARTLGLVGEVLPRERLLARAWEVAAMLTQKPQRVLRNTRIALTQRMKKHFQEELGYGLLLEGHGI
jgi:enoyl-CoA hydratase/carnithine racemase